VESYARRLVSGEMDVDIGMGMDGDEEMEERPGEGGGLSGCREAVEITTRNPKKSEWHVSFNGDAC